MKNFYLTVDGNLNEIREYIDKCWINVVNPDDSDIQFLSSFGIDEDLVNDALEPNERARFGQDEDVIYVITKLPYYDENDEEVPYKTFPLGIAIKPEAIITISAIDNEVTRDFVMDRVRDFSTKKHYRFLLRMFERAAIYYLRYLKEIRKKSNEIEQELHRSTRNKELVALLNLEKSLVFFTTSLRSNELMFEKLKRKKLLTLYEEDEELFEDITIENRQAIEMANIYSDILTGMMDAFASVISNNLNVVMKILTIVTLVLQIPMLTASIYGMNLGHLPMADNPHALFLTMGSSAIVAIIFGFVLFRIRWFR